MCLKTKVITIFFLNAKALKKITSLNYADFLKFFFKEWRKKEDKELCDLQMRGTPLVPWPMTVHRFHLLYNAGPVITENTTTAPQILHKLYRNIINCTQTVQKHYLLNN